MAATCVAAKFFNLRRNLKFKMFNRKYKILKTVTYERDGVILHPIVALKNIGPVLKGHIGGFVENESNLSQKGNCWIMPGSCVYGKSKVEDDAVVYGDAVNVVDSKISGDTCIFDNARVYNSIVDGDTFIRNNARVRNAYVHNCTIGDNARVLGSAFRDTFVSNCFIAGDAVININRAKTDIENACFGYDEIITGNDDYAILGIKHFTFTIFGCVDNVIKVGIRNKCEYEYDELVVDNYNGLKTYLDANLDQGDDSAESIANAVFELHKLIETKNEGSKGGEE